ncbi:hypothetical protein T02_249 [Trichinella nativa]|uniref:Uncharacterized protein n=1 Tax=Trichinella nativa TaxID=6335 RepID=A0A0V1LR89_9BILA|nr:hypothetical protein T02_249 [Trichinella nativa]
MELEYSTRITVIFKRLYMIILFLIVQIQVFTALLALFVVVIFSFVLNVTFHSLYHRIAKDITSEEKRISSNPPVSASTALEQYWTNNNPLFEMWQFFSF